MYQYHIRNIVTGIHPLCLTRVNYFDGALPYMCSLPPNPYDPFKIALHQFIFSLDSQKISAPYKSRKFSVGEHMSVKCSMSSGYGNEGEPVESCLEWCFLIKNVTNCSLFITFH